MATLGAGLADGFVWLLCRAVAVTILPGIVISVMDLSVTRVADWVQRTGFRWPRALYAGKVLTLMSIAGTDPPPVICSPTA